MPNFPIDYANQTPPGAGPSVRARLDTDTGAGAIASTIASAGKQLAGLGMEVVGKIQDAQDAMDMSTLDRQMGEIRNAAHEQMRLEQDEIKQRAIADKATADIANLAQAASPRVQRAYGIKFNELAPQIQAHFGNEIMQTKIKRAEDSYHINSTAWLESGDPNAELNYFKTQDMAQATGIITPEVAEDNKKNYGANHAITLAYKMMSTKDPANIDNAVAMLDTVQNPSLKQSEQIAHIRSIGETEKRRVQTDNFQSAYTNIVDMYDPKNSIIDVADMASGMRAQLAAMEKMGKINPEQRWVLESHVRSAENFALSGVKTIMSDSDQVEIEDIIDKAHTGLEKEEINAGRTRLMQILSGNPKLQETMKRYNDALRGADYSSIKANVQREIDKQQIPVADQPKLRSELSQMKSDLIAASPADRAKAIAERVAEYRQKPKASLPDTGKIADSISALESQRKILQTDLVGLMDEAKAMDSLPWKERDPANPVGKKHEIARESVQRRMNHLDQQIKENLNKQAEFKAKFSAMSPAPIGRTATGKNGEKYILQNGKWVRVK